jgi:hypothetical protein
MRREPDANTGNTRAHARGMIHQQPQGGMACESLGRRVEPRAPAFLAQRRLASVFPRCVTPAVVYRGHEMVNPVNYIEAHRESFLGRAPMVTVARDTPVEATPDDTDALLDRLDLDELIDSTLGVNCIVCGRRTVTKVPSRRKTCDARCRKRLSRIRRTRVRPTTP